MRQKPGCHLQSLSSQRYHRDTLVPVPIFHGKYAGSWWPRSVSMTFHVSRRIYLGSERAVSDLRVRWLAHRDGAACISSVQQPATINIAAWMHVNERCAEHKAVRTREKDRSPARVCTRVRATRRRALSWRFWLDTKTTGIHLACYTDRSSQLLAALSEMLVNVLIWAFSMLVWIFESRTVIYDQIGMWNSLGPSLLLIIKIYTVKNF